MASPRHRSAVPFEPFGKAVEVRAADAALR
jgi:hypothetical protein